MAQDKERIVEIGNHTGDCSRHTMTFRDSSIVKDLIENVESMKIGIDRKKGSQVTKGIQESQRIAP